MRRQFANRLLACAVLFILAALPAAAVGPDDLPAESGLGTAQKAIDLGNYKQAIDTITALDPKLRDTADANNLLGFAHRKLKDYPTAKRYYDRALQLDRNHLGALEYSGEWHVEMGDIASARVNLDRLKQLCGTCEEYRDLAEAIARSE